MRADFVQGVLFQRPLHNQATMLGYFCAALVEFPLKPALFRGSSEGYGNLGDCEGVRIGCPGWDTEVKDSEAAGEVGGVVISE